MLSKALIAASIAAVAIPGTAAAQSGVVVKVDKTAKLTAVAGAHGSVALVHGTATARLGQKVSYSATTRANGTFQTTGFRVLGAARTVHVRGVVLAHQRTGYVLSANGAVLPIRVLRRTSSASDSGTPATGTSVDVTASLASGQLDQQSVQPLLTDARSGAIEGKLVTGPAGTIAVRSSGLTLVISAPATINTSTFKLGDEVLASFQRQADGSLVLTALVANGQQDDEQDDNDDDSGDDDGGGNSSGSATITGTIGASTKGSSGH
jgi:hypothetical protein